MRNVAGVEESGRGGLEEATLQTALEKLAVADLLFVEATRASSDQRPVFQTALASILPNLETEIVKCSDLSKRFVLLPKRWIVERSIVWLNRCRRLAKDWENLNFSGLVFLRLASIRLMLRKLFNST